MSPGRYSAFLVRLWQLPSGRERIEVQHIQSGNLARFASLPAAIAWIATRRQREEAQQEATIQRDLREHLEG
jgi:hypothetical protein